MDPFLNILGWTSVVFFGLLILYFIVSKRREMAGSRDALIARAQRITDAAYGKSKEKRQRAFRRISQIAATHEDRFPGDFSAQISYNANRKLLRP